MVCEHSAHRGLRGLAVAGPEHAAEPRAVRDRACAARRCLGRERVKPALPRVRAHGTRRGNCPTFDQDLFELREAASTAVTAIVAGLLGRQLRVD